MCGRYSQLRSWSDLVRLYRITASQTPLNLQPRYNIAPTQQLPVVRYTREGLGALPPSDNVVRSIDNHVAQAARRHIWEGSRS